MTHRTIKVPEPIRDGSVVPIVSFSGGKDSTALLIALREARIELRHVVFADTGWEHPATYEHVDAIARLLGVEVIRVGRPGGMVAAVRERASFPFRKGRWCTEELKAQPIQAYTATLAKTLAPIELANTIGVRAEESAARALLPAWEDDRDWDSWVWRPILDWSVDDVLEAHRRRGLPVNPLYRRGHERVGCWPCIMASKDEVRLVAEADPARIDEIEALERETTLGRAERNAITPGRYKHTTPTFFQARDGVEPQGIREIVKWSRTDRGGRQFSLLAPAPSGGCFRWGLCEPPQNGGVS